MAETISARLREAMTRHASAGLTAVIAPEAVSYADLRTRIDGFAAGFHGWGVRRGAMVGVIAPKTVDAIAAYFGAMQAGACVCFLEPGLAPDIVAEQAEVVGMHHLVADETLIGSFDGPALASLAIRPLGGLRGEGAFVDEAVGAEDNAMLLFTSGSTGRPKGVLLRHGALICNAEGVAHHTGTTPDDRLLHVMPLHHT